MVEELRGAGQILSGIRGFKGRVERMEVLRPELTKKYPNKWAAMSDGDISVVSDSLENILAEIAEKGISRTDAVIEFLDTEPKSIIL